MATLKPLLLGTTSPYKIELFQRLDLPFTTAAPPFEEHLDQATGPERLALNMAEGKARSLADTHGDHLIIGADQVLALGNRVFDKPGSTEAAVAQLQQLSGRTHCLHTAIAVYDPGRGVLIRRSINSYLTLHAKFSVDYLTKLVEAEQSQDCVGGYKWESKGFMLMREVDSPDTNAIVGLPLMALTEVLGALGYFPDRFQK